MFSRRWYIVPVIVVLLVGFVIAGGYAIHRAGWMQGYAIGLAADSAGDIAAGGAALAATGALGQLVDQGIVGMGVALGHGRSPSRHQRARVGRRS